MGWAAHSLPSQEDYLQSRLHGDTREHRLRGERTGRAQQETGRPERPAPPPEGTRATARLATRSPRKRASVRAETPALPQTPEHRATAPWSRAEESEEPEGRAVPGVAAPSLGIASDPHGPLAPRSPPRSPCPGAAADTGEPQAVAPAALADGHGSLTDALSSGWAPSPGDPITSCCRVS